MFHLAELFRRYFLEVREVEAQAVRRNERTFLFYVRTQYLTQSLVEQVGTRVVGCTRGTLLRIHTSHHRCIEVFGQFLGNVYRQVVFFLRVDDVDAFKFVDQHTRIAYLTSAFGVERCFAQHDLIQRLVLLLHLTVAQDGGFILRIVVAHERGFALFQRHPVARFNGGSVTCALFLFLHFHLEALHVGSQSVFAENQFGEVEGEAERVIQRKGIHAADFRLSGCFRVCHHLVEQADTRLQRAQEGFFFLLDNLFDERLLRFQFGISPAHVFYQHRH